MKQEDDALLCKVVMANDEPFKTIAPYLVCQGEVPKGWSEVGKQGTRQECIDYITDIAIGETTINEEISRLIENGRLIESEDLDRKIRADDIIAVDLKTRVIPGGKRLQIKQDKDVQIIKMGEGAILAEIEQELIGLKIGESSQISAKFPETYHDVNFAGIDAEFSIVIKSIFERQRYNNINEYMEDHNIESLENLKKMLIDKKSSWLQMLSRMVK